MGLNTAGGSELAEQAVTGNFTGTGNGTAAMFYGPFNASLWGTFVGTCVLERSFDGGTTYIPCAVDASGTANSYTGAVTLVVTEPEPGVFYRFRCSAYTSGTINYRLSTGPRLT